MSSTCADKSSLRAKIAMISIFGPVSMFTDKLLLLVEYLQILSPILLFALFFQQKEQETAFPNSLLFIARLINPGLWISFEKLNAAEIIILSGLFAFTVLKYLLLLWIIYKFKRNSRPQKLFIKLWRTLFRIQGRVLYFYVGFFWVNFAMKSQALMDEQGETSDNKRIAVSLLAIIFDSAFSFLLYARYYYMLPMKGFLSGKDNIVEMITLIQKFLLQILTVFLPLNSESSVWLITVVNVVADLIRNLHFFKTLPLYNFKALHYQAIILMVLSSANLACFVSIIGKSSHSRIINITFFVYLWAILSLLSIIIARVYIKNRFWRIICDPSITSPALLLHRISAVSQLRDEKSTENQASWASLAKASVNNNFKDLLKITEETGLQLDSRNSANIIFGKYLEKLLEIHPHNEKIQLYAAQYFVKKSQKYGDAIKTVTALRVKGSSNNIKLNAELLLIQIQEELQEKAAERNQESQIDPTSYLQEQGLIAKLQASMLEQACTQIKVCEEIKKNTPDTFFIQKSAQVFNRLRGQNIKKINLLYNSLSEANLEPLLLYAHYFLSLNHSLEQYSHFLKIHTQRFQKHQRYFDQSDLCQKNLFQTENRIYLLSGHKATAGEIIFAPKPFGTRQGESTIISRTAPCLRNVTAQFYQHVAESYDETFFNKTAPGHIYHQDGYLIEVMHHLNIHPYVTQGFYFVLFLRPIVTTRDLILVLENGDIDCGTKNVSEKLALFNEKKGCKNIMNISEELTLINKAFNMVAFPQKGDQGDLTLKVAQELYNLYTTKGREIWLSSLSDSNISYLYHCKIVNEIYGSRVIKTLILQENIKASMPMTTPTTTQTVQKVPQDEEEEAQPCDEDEKEQGWIDLKPLTSRKKRHTLLVKSEEETGTDSRKTHDEGGTSRFLLETERKPSYVDTKRKVKQKESQDKYQGKGEQYSGGASSWFNSTSKESSQKKKLASLFALSLENKHYSRIFKGINTLLYMAFAVFLMSQFIIMATVNKNVDNFKAQKDVLRTFQLRNFFLITLEGSVRQLYDIGTGALNASGRRRTNYLYQAQQSLANLTQMNQKLLLNANMLSEEIRFLLWDKDIPIYYTYFGESPESFVEENTFGGIDRIITAAAAVINYNGASLAKMKDPAQFVFRNSLNDILVKSNWISETIISFLNSQRGKISTKVVEYFIIELVLMIVLFGIFILVLWKQYSKEAKNLSALCRIGNKKIDETLRNFVKFKEMIEEQKSMSSSIQIYEGEKAKNQKNQVLRESSKSPNHKGLYRNYYIFIVIFLVFLVALVGLTTAGVNLTTKLLDSFKSEQEQIYFLDYLRTRTTLSRQAARELLATNNTGRVENKLPLEGFISLIDEIKQAKSEIYTKLLDEETVREIPTVKTVLLGNMCQLLNATNMYNSTSYCQSLSSAGKESGLVYLLGDYEDGLRTTLSAYKASNLTAASLLRLQRTLYTLIPSYYNVMASGALVLSDMIDAQLEEQLNENDEDKSNYLVASSFLMVTIGVLMWIFILRKLKEGVNRFKNVLKIFPAELVLSSFILRVFLRKTSKYTFDSFKF